MGYYLDILAIDKLVEINIIGEEILEIKVESVDALIFKQLELYHVFEIKQLELEKQERERKAVKKTRTWNKENGNVGKGETSRIRV